MSAKVIGFHADPHLDLERHRARAVDFEIVAGHAERLDMATQRVFEAVVYVAPAAPVRSQEHRVPAARPAKRRGRTLNLVMPARDGRIVLGRHGARERAKGFRRIAADGVGALRLGAAPCREGIP